MQTEYHGPGSLSNLREIIARHNSVKLFLVTGKDSFAESGAESVFDDFRLNGLDIIRFCDFSVNPKLEDALPGIELLTQFQPDMVIAVGGGSVIDMGKLITALSAHPGSNYRSILKNSSITASGPPLVAIPTTAGTGSEATHFAVAYMDQKKHSLAHRSILPDYAIIDPELMYNTSSYQTAVSGMDALCQAVESYWSVHSTVQSREFASQAIKIILASITDAVNKKTIESRQEMARGANLAGKAIDMTKTTAPHAMSYALTTHYSIPHGHAVALILGKFFIINEANCDALSDKRGKLHFSGILKELYALFDCRDGYDCADKWYHCMKAIGLEADISTFGVKDEKDYNLIIESVNPERLENHPVRLNRALLSQVFRI